MKLKYLYKCLITLTILILSVNSFAGPADMSGTVSFETSNSQTRVNIKIPRITNNNSGGTTGTLHVTLRYTNSSDPFSSGFNVARINLANAENISPATLAAGRSYINIDFDTNFNRPPAGVYFTHLYTSQFPDLNVALDVITFSRTARVVAPVSIEDDIGGGSFNLFWVLFLIITLRNFVYKRRENY